MIPELSMDAELMIAAVAISVLGLPHGALDPWVAWRAKLFETPLGLLSFLVGYIALCLVGLGVWAIAPTCSLIAFLAYSALHFGRDHERRCALEGAPYGLVVIGAPALARPDEVSAIYQALITAPSESALLISQAALALGVAGLIYSSIRAQIPHLALSVLWLEVGALLALSHLVSPLWYFVIFFCALHSPRHLIHELRLATAQQRLIALGVMVIITLATLGLTWLISDLARAQLDSVEASTYRAIFIGLSVLTVPHMLVIEWERRQAQERAREQREQREQGAKEKRERPITPPDAHMTG